MFKQRKGECRCGYWSLLGAKTSIVIFYKAKNNFSNILILFKNEFMLRNVSRKLMGKPTNNRAEITVFSFQFKPRIVNNILIIIFIGSYCCHRASDFI